LIIQIVAAFFSTLFFAVLFNVSRYELIYCGIVGAIGWTSYLIIKYYSNSIVFSTFIATLIISVLSHILAKKRRNPVTIFQISGIIPLVPGAGMYKTLYYIVNNDYSMSTFYLFETLQIAGSIAIGMILVASFNKLYKPSKNVRELSKVNYTNKNK